MPARASKARLYERTRHRYYLAAINDDGVERFPPPPRFPHFWRSCFGPPKILRTANVPMNLPKSLEGSSFSLQAAKVAEIRRLRSERIAVFVTILRGRDSKALFEYHAQVFRMQKAGLVSYFRDRQRGFFQ